MRLIFTTWLVCLSVLVLSSCSLFQEVEVDEYKGLSPKDLYERAQNEASNLETDNSVKTLGQILARYPTSKYALQAKIEIPYVLYKAGRHNASLASIEEFIRLHPTHPSVDYAYYLRGVVSADKSKSLFDELNLTDRASRDIDSVEDALRYYIQLIEKFPNSKYTNEAKTDIIRLKNILARNELSIAIFYTNKEAYISAVNRCKYIIENYDNTPSVPAALHLMVHNYTLLGQTDLANDAQRVLNASYPKYTPHYTLD